MYFPPGKYLTGAINLKSNVTLHIEAGAVILGSPEVEDYPLAPDPWGEQKQQISALICGTGIENITLAGRGVIDGQGGVWWNRQRLANPKAKQALSKEDLEEAGKVRFGRPHLIKLIRCRNVHIADCHIGVGDDCVTIKSGKDETGRRVGKPCENITVTNCAMIHGHGGVVVGSEMSGGARNISVSNCVFQRTLRGIRLKTQRGRGGLVEGMVVSNIVIEDVPEPFSLTMYYSGGRRQQMAEPVGDGTPQFRNVLIQNILARGARTAGYILGLPEMPVAGVSFSHLRVSAKEGFLRSWAKDLAFHDVQVDTGKGPALTARNVEGLEFDGFRTAQPHPEAPVIDLNQVRDVFLRGCWAARGAGIFVKIGGPATHNASVSGTRVG